MTKLIFEHYQLPLDTYIKSQELFEQAFEAMQGKIFEQAIELFKASLAIFDQHPQCHGNIGICHARLGRKAEALQALERALELDPNYEPALVNRLVVERLQEGEALPSDEMRLTEYYREYTLENKSYIQEMIDASKLDGQADKRLGFSNNTGE